MNYNFYSEEDKREVRRIYNVDEATIKRDVQILKEWFEKQLHLPQGKQDDFFFENMLIKNKCIIEKAKKSIDAYYTCRAIWPELYENAKNVVPSRHNMRFIPLKPLSAQKERYLLMAVASSDVSLFRLLDMGDVMLGAGELMLKYDYNTGFRTIVDLQNFTSEMLFRIQPAVLLKAREIIGTCYGSRVTAVHFYRAAGYISGLLKLLKVALPVKLYNRIMIHDDQESLLKAVPPEILPKEYGGKGKPLSEILAEQDELFDKHRTLFEELITVKSNEKLRIGKSLYNGDVYGIDGTFKKLNLD